MADIGLINICMGIQYLGLKWGFCGAKQGGGAILTPNEVVLPLGGFLRLCQFW